MNMEKRNNWHLTKEYSTLEKYMEKFSAFDTDYLSGNNDPIKRERAIKLLKDFFDYYEKCSLSKKIIIYEGYELHYYSFLPRARIFHTKLMENDLIYAIHELYDLLYYYPGLQTRVHSAVITSWKMFKEKYQSEFNVMS